MVPGPDSKKECIALYRRTNSLLATTDTNKGSGRHIRTQRRLTPDVSEAAIKCRRHPRKPRPWRRATECCPADWSGLRAVTACGRCSGIPDGRWRYRSAGPCARPGDSAGSSWARRDRSRPSSPCPWSSYQSVVHSTPSRPPQWRTPIRPRSATPCRPKLQRRLLPRNRSARPGASAAPAIGAAHRFGRSLPVLLARLQMQRCGIVVGSVSVGPRSNCALPPAS